MFYVFVEIGLMIAGVICWMLKIQDWTTYLLYASLGLLAYLIFKWREVAEDFKFLVMRPKVWLYRVWKEWGEQLLIALLLAFVIRTFIIGPYKIPTGSMIPTFMIGDRIFVDKVTYRFRPPHRGEIIVFKYPEDKKKDFVKRLIGLPGEEIEIRDGKIFVNGRPLEEVPYSGRYYYNRDEWNYGKTGQKIKIPGDMFFVLGDNSSQSSDSRNWGFVPKKNLVGKAFFIWWPPDRIKIAR